MEDIVKNGTEVLVHSLYIAGVGYVIDTDTHGIIVDKSPFSEAYWVLIDGMNETYAVSRDDFDILNK